LVADAKAPWRVDTAPTVWPEKRDSFLKLARHRLPPSESRARLRQQGYGKRLQGVRLKTTADSKSGTSYVTK